MLVIVDSMQKLNWDALSYIYAEGLRLRGEKAYPHLSENEQILRAQEDTYYYLRDEFYSNKNAYYAFWLAYDTWTCALRMRPYQDGMLLDALETAPAHRNQGFAKLLLQSVLNQLPQHTKVYSRIMRKNKASINVHLQCGFTKHKPYAVLLDGSFYLNADTYLFCCE